MGGWPLLSGLPLFPVAQLSASLFPRVSSPWRRPSGRNPGSPHRSVGLGLEPTARSCLGLQVRLEEEAEGPQGQPGGGVFSGSASLMAPQPSSVPPSGPLPAPLLLGGLAWASAFPPHPPAPTDFLGLSPTFSGPIWEVAGWGTGPIHKAGNGGW